MGGEGYGAGLAAFRKGDFSRAGDIWRRDLQAAPKGAYTLQLLAACDPRTLERIGRRVPPGGSLRLVPTRLSGRSCYRVLWGIYPDRERAVAAGAGVPAYFTEPPLPVPVARIAP